MGWGVTCWGWEPTGLRGSLAFRVHRGQHQAHCFLPHPIPLRGPQTGSKVDRDRGSFTRTQRGAAQGGTRPAGGQDCPCSQGWHHFPPHPVPPRGPQIGQRLVGDRGGFIRTQRGHCPGWNQACWGQFCRTWFWGSSWGPPCSQHLGKTGGASWSLRQRACPIF